MSNKVVVLQTFQKQAKRLAKRYKSFPKDLQKLVDELKQNAALGIPLGETSIKSAWQFQAKTKAKAAARELSLTFIKQPKPFICCQSTTKPTRKTSPTAN